MIRIEGTRFGLIEVADQSLIRFPRGIIGFDRKTDYVLLERAVGDAAIAVLQSVDSPGLAFPVMDAVLFGGGYPDPPPRKLAREAGLGHTDVAMLVIVAADGEQLRLEANLLAPLVIDLETRRGAQVLLDPERYSTRFSLAAPDSQGVLARLAEKAPGSVLQPATALAAAAAP